MMLLQSITLVFLIVFTCLFFPTIHGKLDSNAKGNQWLPISLISLPPSPSPEAVSQSANGPFVFNVKSFGAVGDGISDDTEAFKLAWDTACHAEESGTILVPKAHIFLIQSTIFTGPCNFNLTFKVDGTILPPDGPDSWPLNRSKRQWLVFYRINGMLMQGSGLVDGRGEKWWSLPCKSHKGINGTTQLGPCDSPVAIRFFMSSNLRVEGLRIKNSPKFHFRFEDCQNVHVENLIITSPSLSPNTDGIHIENTNNVSIYNSVISNGDDCVSIGAGCYDVDIRNITCGPSHGISIGSLGNYNSRACVSNIMVSDSIIKHSDNGVRIKTWQGGRGAVSKVNFRNIYMDTVRNPIIIDQYYCPTKNCLNQSNAVSISNVSYSNIRGTYDVRSPSMRFACSDSVPCTNLTLSQVKLFPAEGKILVNPFCWNAYGVVQTLTSPPLLCLLDGNPLTLPQNDVLLC
ncbi:polygalacturonase At1g48100-like [Abrus precatorius]|uniref:Polygalacturonase At1g48100-like n=1 Tax=Abrus precatorius TaxID=3816 RepID=A0A8B8KZR0_ABRPR|nr:polygalacturonase At1g48100-like [Abrus precatorius]